MQGATGLCYGPHNFEASIFHLLRVGSWMAGRGTKPSLGLGAGEFLRERVGFGEIWLLWFATT